MQSLKAKKADALRAFEAQADELSSQVSGLQRSLSKMLAHYDLSIKKLERIEEESEQQRQLQQIPHKITVPPPPTPTEPKPVLQPAAPPSEAEEAVRLPTTEPQPESTPIFKRPEKRRKRPASATITNTCQILRSRIWMNCWKG